jgi:ABC-type multidrug transport system fused ATPase/permease subunit
VLFTDIRFHDTISRGRLLNRFGKDFEGKTLVNQLDAYNNSRVYSGIDSSLSDNFGRSVRNAISVSITLTTVSIVGGWPFLFALCILAILYWNGASVLRIDHSSSGADVWEQCREYTANAVETCGVWVSFLVLN